LDLLSFFGSAVQCLIPTNNSIFINISCSKDTGDAFWDERKQLARSLKELFMVGQKRLEAFYPLMHIK
jgi:hypothetical protein